MELEPYDLYRMSIVLKILDRAREHGIEVNDLEDKYAEIESIVFEEPCFLLVQIRNVWFFYTPFAIFRLKELYPGMPRHVFREITGAKRVPYGKDALKKIEALLLQASI